MENEQLYEKTPVISAELLEWLDRQFPLQSPELTATERQIFLEVGQRSVVDHLKSIHLEQQDNLLEPD
tara:strand:- start:319 stop:522 length:204 start_codon:yes stop_codon:yes gene_type:complete